MSSTKLFGKPGCLARFQALWDIAEIKKAGSNDPTNLLTLGERANKVSVRLAGLKNEYWPLNHTSTLSVLLVGVLLTFQASCQSLAMTQSIP